MSEFAKASMQMPTV